MTRKRRPRQLKPSDNYYAELADRNVSINEAYKTEQATSEKLRTMLLTLQRELDTANRTVKMFFVIAEALSVAVIAANEGKKR